MARKTAMRKEPGKVSIALPQSEKDRLNRSRERFLDPIKPPKMDSEGNYGKKESLKRLSPGVYRNSQGQLVGSKGQALPKPSAIQNALDGASRAAGQQTGMEGGRMPAGRPGQQMPQKGSPYDNFKPIRPQDRARFGIDPRDPNQYSVGPNGEVMGTLMGWSPNGNGGGFNQMPNMANQQFVQDPMQQDQNFRVESMIRQLEQYNPQARNLFNFYDQQQQQLRQQPPMQNLMYPFAQGQTPPDMRLFAPANPQGMNMMQGLQPQVAAQPNTVSGLLRRGR